jgi:hypothetical protein
MNTRLFISAIAAAAALSFNAFAADAVSSSTEATIAKSYGRAGGLVGADRISGLQGGSAQIGIAYDADVAARTNMQRAQGGNAGLGVAYDADVAARTNMPRGGVNLPTHKAAGVEGTKSN